MNAANCIYCVRKQKEAHRETVLYRDDSSE